MRVSVVHTTVHRACVYVFDYNTSLVACHLTSLCHCQVSLTAPAPLEHHTHSFRCLSDAMHDVLHVQVATPDELNAIKRQVQSSIAQSKEASICDMSLWLVDKCSHASSTLSATMQDAMQRCQQLNQEAQQAKQHMQAQVHAHAAFTAICPCQYLPLPAHARLSCKMSHTRAAAGK